jgi:hypothetical protein
LKTRLWLLAVALIMTAASVFGQTKPVSNQYQHINNTWNVPNSTYPDCTATVTLNCLSTYTYTATDPYGAASINTVPNGLLLAGATFAYNWTPGSFLYCGTWTASVVANYIDGSGAGVSSTADTVTVAVSCPLVASPVTNLKVTLAP